MKLPTTYRSDINKNTLVARLIIERVSLWYDLSTSEIFRRRRFRHLIVARQELFYFIRLFCPKMSLASIGGLSSLYRDKVTYDHATILHSVKNIEDLLFWDKSYKSSMILKRNSLASLIQKEIGQEEKESSFVESFNELADALSDKKEVKEVELLIMYLRKSRNERETDKDIHKNTQMEVV